MMSPIDAYQKANTKQEYNIQHPLGCVYMASCPLGHAQACGMVPHTCQDHEPAGSVQQAAAPHHARSPSSSSQMIGPLASAVRLNPSDLRPVHVPQRPVVVDCFFSA